jgi:hypothetical protein
MTEEDKVYLRQTALQAALDFNKDVTINIDELIKDAGKIESFYLGEANLRSKK